VEFQKQMHRVYIIMRICMYAKNTLSRMTKLIFNVSKDITSPRKQLHDVYLLNLK